jgi:ABC-2 type transport system ATP-binding protein
MSRLLLEVRNVTKRFGTYEALKGVSLSLYEGEIVSLLGVNGAGKTTLSSIIGTLIPPTSGDVLYKGVSIYNDICVFRRDLGFCQQKPNLNPMLTLRQNLEFAGLYYGMSEVAIQERIVELSQQLGLGAYLDKMPSVLSGGYRQRFMIARSIMHKPRLVIFDEPTVALDPDIRRALWDQIRALRDSGITILLTTHYMDEADVLSDRVVVLDRGRVQLIETPQKLKQSFQKNNLEDVFLHLMNQSSEGV